MATQLKEEQPEIAVSIKDLLEAGAHFGHQTQRWNPKMRRFIFEERNGLYIIDLAKTLQQIRKAVSVVVETVGKHRSILFVGTKKQAKTVVSDVAEKSGEFFVNERWLGGMLTNLSTIRNSIKKLDRVEKKITTSADAMTKKELSLMTKLQLKLERNLSGIRGMRKPPGLIVIVDPSKEHIAVAEAKKLGIPVLALVDTNCDPDPIDYVIACNDDALKSIKLILDTLCNAIIEKKAEMKLAAGVNKEGEEEKSEDDEELSQKKETVIAEIIEE